MIRPLVLLIAITFCIVACGNSEKRALLVGKWKYDVAASRASVEGKAISRIEENAMNKLLSQMEKATIEYKEDGTLVVKPDVGAPIQGTWALNSGTELVFRVYNKDQIETIEELTAQRLILADKPEQNIVFKRYLVRIE